MTLLCLIIDDSSLPAPFHHAYTLCVTVEILRTRFPIFLCFKLPDFETATTIGFQIICIENDNLYSLSFMLNFRPIFIKHCNDQVNGSFNWRRNRRRRRRIGGGRRRRRRRRNSGVRLHIVISLCFSASNERSPFVSSLLARKVRFRVGWRG